MKASLKLEDIGQRIGLETWEFNSGKVTEIRGRNASGKSRILKSCALALSLPITSEEIRKDAVRFGIAKADNAECSPLLNSNKHKAIIELQYDDVLKIVELFRDGTEKINVPGNQKFLYCSMLTENSKIHSNIDQGISDFSWIVTEMSLAKYYEVINEIVNSYSELINSKKEEVEKKGDEIKKNEAILKERKQEYSKVNSEIETIENEINAIQLNPQLKKDRMILIEKLKKLKKRYTEDNTELKNLQKNISEKLKIIDNNNDDIEKNNVKLGESRDKKKKLETIDISFINEEIEKLRIENENLYKSQGAIKEELGGKRVKSKEYEDTLNKLIKKGIEETICWTCGQGNISKAEIERKVKEVNKEITPLIAKLDKINSDINSNNKEIIKYQEQKNDKDNIPKIKEEIEKLNVRIANLQADKDSLEGNIARIESKIPSLETSIYKYTNDIKREENKLKDLEDQIRQDEEIKPKLDEKDKLTKKLGSIEKEINNLEININQGAKIELLGFKIDISKANKIIKDLGGLLSNVEDHLLINIKEQREGAAIKFNENIEKIIKELNFPEFKEISLDLENYNLNIIRKDNTYQPINSLSGGEKIVVSSLLQISAKETYNRDIPFIVGDDIILKMDNERREVFENYLKSIAKQNDWFIILTRITDEDLIKEEI